MKTKTLILLALAIAGTCTQVYGYSLMRKPIQIPRNERPIHYPEYPRPDPRKLK